MSEQRMPSLYVGLPRNVYFTYDLFQGLRIDAEGTRAHDASLSGFWAIEYHQRRIEDHR